MRRARAVLVVLGVALASCTAAPLAFGSPSGPVYGGEDSKGSPIVIHVDARGRAVRSLQVTWLTRCGLGAGAVDGTPTELVGSDDIAVAAPIGADGRWGARASRTKTIGPSRYRLTYEVAGRRVGRTIYGTIRAVAEELNAGGVLVRRCGQAVRYRTKERDVFGGRTAQGNPIVITLNSTRTAATLLDWAWNATCTPGPAVRPETRLDVTIFTPDRLRGFPINRSGAFAVKAETQPYDDIDARLMTVYTYSASGRRNGRTLTGVVSASFVDIDTSDGPLRGTTIRTCRSGKVSFTASD